MRYGKGHLIVAIFLLLVAGCEGKKETDRVSFSPPELNKVLVLGVDGASWNVIDPLMESGKLPNLQSFMKKAGYGKISMTKGDDFSPVIWTSMFTGVHPERHGLIDEERSLSIFRRQKALWNYLRDSNRFSTIINIPGTFPPEEMLGYEISGFPMEHSLIGSIRGTFITLRNNMDSASPEAETIELLDTRTQISYTLTIRFEEKIGNDRYQFQLTGNNTSQSIALALNEWSSWLTFEMGADFHVKARLRLLDIEEKEGFHLYLSPLDIMPSSEWTYYNPPDLIDEVDKVVDNYIPHEIGWRKLIETPIALGFLYDYLVDQERSRLAVGLSLYRQRDWPLFIHVITLLDRVQHSYWPYMEPEYYDNIDPDLVSRYGDRVEKAYIEMDRQIGEFLKYVDENTTVFIVSDHGFHARGLKGRFMIEPKKLILSLFRDNEREETNFYGVHQRKGVYMISGKPVRSNHQGDDIAIVDIAPTILYILGQDIPDDLDGEVIDDLFVDDYLEDFPPVFVDGGVGLMQASPREIDPSAVEQIKSMGYIE